MSRGSLVVVGTGYLVGGQITALALSYIERADRVLYMVGEPLTADYLRSLRPDAVALDDSYVEGRCRDETYREMSDRLLAEVRAGHRVCAVFYGHPGIFVASSHRAIRLARAEGYDARMLPGVSAEDCLFADLGVDPSTHGCQSYDATDLVIRPRRLEPHTALVVWQIGVVGVEDYREGALWSREGLRLLAEVLAETYPDGHPCVVYEAAVLPVVEPRIDRTTIGELGGAPATNASTLYVPAIGPAPLDRARADRLGMR